MMPLTSAHELLSVWERGRGLHPVDRALTLLATAYPDTPADELASLSLGERDARLIALREQAFGDRMNGLAECARCHERFELELSTADIRVQPEAEPSAATLELDGEGRRWRFRPANSHDLAAVTRCETLEQARRLLAERCLLDPAGADVTADVIDELAARLARCDPQAEVLLDLGCPACGHAQQLIFDISSFLWTEVSAEARRILRQVDTLARAYGWREADILALSPARRQLYLEMVS